MEGFCITIFYMGGNGATREEKHMVRARNSGMAKRKVLEEYRGRRVYAVSNVPMKRKTKTK